MATVKEQKLDRVVQARLERAGVRPRRFLFTEEFEAWVRTELPSIPSTKTWGEHVPARRQVALLIDQYLRCDRLHIPSTLRCLNPQFAGVWELKTGDVRLSGWFARFDVFVAAAGGDAFTIKEGDLYDAKISLVIRIRRDGRHDFIPGADPRRVITL